jgi:DNA-binding MarR family transcriptional regulator
VGGPSATNEVTDSDDCLGEVEERIDDNVAALLAALPPVGAVAPETAGSMLYMVTIIKYSNAMASPNDSPPPSTGYLLWHLSLRWRVALDRALAPLGLTSSQYGVLASLHGLSGAGSRPSQRELASFSGLEPMHVSKLIRALERAGLVERAGNPNDTRAVQLTVTARGVEVVTAARQKVLELEDRRLAPLGGRRSEQSVELRDMLLTLLRHAEATNTEGDGEPAAR